MEDKTAHSNAQTYILFAITTFTCAIGSLSQTVMNSMLLTVSVEFNVGEDVAQWLTSVYMLAIGITVPLVSFLSKRFDDRGLIKISLIFFFAGSLVDMVTSDFWVLLVGRILQAIATGITLPMMATIAMMKFPKGQNATAMGISGIAMGFAPNIGPPIGGVLVTTLGWRSYYVIQAILLVVLFMLTITLLRREQVASEASRLDLASFVLSTLGFGGLLIGFTNAASMPLVSIFVWVPFVLGALCLVLFIARQKRITNPLIDLDIMKDERYRIALTAQCCLFASFMGITLILPLFVQNVMGLSAIDAGNVFLAPMIFAVVFNPLAGILVDKIGARPVTIGAGLFLAVGAVAMVFADGQTSFWTVVVIQAIRGIGISSLIGPWITWGLSTMDFRLMMDGSAFFATARQACASFGTALMMLLITIGSGTGVAAISWGYQLAFGFSGALAVVVLVLALWKVRS